MQMQQKKVKGFTILELLVVIAIIAVISVSARHYFNLRGRNIHRLYILIGSIISFILLAAILLIIKK